MSTKTTTEKCGNTIYDILTILISIADVATDIWVAVDFYNKDRIIFFWISITIFIIAHFGYAITFAIEFAGKTSKLKSKQNVK